MVLREGGVNREGYRVCVEGGFQGGLGGAGRVHEVNTQQDCFSNSLLLFFFFFLGVRLGLGQDYERTYSLAARH